MAIVHSWLRLAGKEDNYNISDELTTDCGVICL